MRDDLKRDGLLPPNATRPEDGLAATAALIDQADDPIGRMWDPWRVPAVALPWAASQARVPLWDSSWPETKQRSIIAQSPELNHLKGKVAGIRRYVEIMGGEVVGVALPPDGIYLDEGWTDAEHAAWLARFAEVRIYDRPGTDTVLWDFLDETYLDDDPAGVGGAFADEYNPKPKRRAVVIDRGTERDLELIEVRSIDIHGTVHIVEQLFDRAYLEPGLYVDADAWLDIDYLDEPDPLLFIQVDNGQVSGRRGFDAPLVSNRPHHVVETGEADDFFLDCGALDDGYLDVSIADRMIYDSYRIYDPTRSGGVPDGGYCLDDPTRFEIPPNHMLVDVDATFDLTDAAMFLDHSYFGDYLVADDGAWRRRLLDATAAANPTSDRTLVSTAMHRPVRFSDGFTFGEFRFGEFINPTETRHA